MTGLFGTILPNTSLMLLTTTMLKTSHAQFESSDSSTVVSDWNLPYSLISSVDDGATNDTLMLSLYESLTSTVIDSPPLPFGQSSPKHPTNNNATNSLNPIRQINSMEFLLILPYSIIFVMAIVGNMLVILTLCLNRSMFSVTNIFLLNLAISDLLLGVFCMPFTLVGVLQRRFIFGPFMCHLISYLQSKHFCLRLSFFS